MAGKTKSPSDLRKRVLRFLEREERRDVRLSKLLAGLRERASPYLFGGILRDIALHGIDNFESDIDIVFIGDQRKVDDLVALFPSERNRFGGYRISAEYWFVDVWNARHTWAFKEGLREFHGIESMLTTTITNWESILFDLRQQRLIHPPDYLDNLQSGFLDVVLPKNPNQLGMCVRLIRAYTCKEARLLSANAVHALKKGLEAYEFEHIRGYEQTHYKQTFIDKSTYEYLKHHQQIEWPDLLPAELEDIKAPLSFGL